MSDYSGIIDKILGQKVGAHTCQVKCKHCAPENSSEEAADVIVTVFDDGYTQTSCPFMGSDKSCGYSHEVRSQKFLENIYFKLGIILVILIVVLLILHFLQIYHLLPIFNSSTQNNLPSVTPNTSP